jgi:hypothetical protein
MHPYRSYRPARTEGNPGRGAAVAGLLLAIVACAGCGHEENSSAAAPTLVAMPAAARARCTKAERLRPVCPTRIPDSKWQDRAGWDDARGEFAWNGLFFELQAGAQHPGQPELDSPPRFVHVAVGVGRASALLPFSWPPAGQVQLRNGLLRTDAQRSSALSFGPRRWAGIDGQLLLAPPHERGGGIVGTHLIFAWPEGRDLDVVTIHAWEPLTETERVLREVVESLPHKA